MCKILAMEGNQMLRIQVGIWAWRCIIVASGVPKKNTLRSKNPSILSAGWFIVCDKIRCVKRKMWINTVFGWQPITGCESKCLSELGSCIIEPCCNIILRKKVLLWKCKIRRCQCVIIPYIRSKILCLNQYRYVCEIWFPAVCVYKSCVRESSQVTVKCIQSKPFLPLVYTYN